MATLPAWPVNFSVASKTAGKQRVATLATLATLDILRAENEFFS